MKISAVMLLAFLCFASCSDSDTVPDAGPDTGTDSDINASEHLCGDELCTAEQYCVKDYLGVTQCGDIAMPDAGSCPTGYQECQDGSCSLIFFTNCMTLPADCESCDCLPGNEGCGAGAAGQCTKSPAGFIDVECANP